MNQKLIQLSIFLITILVLSACQEKSKHHKLSRNERMRTNGTFIDTLFIVDDSTYAPYEFYTTDKNGARVPAGILVDIWDLWSKKTGIPIKFQLTSFSKAIRIVEEGRADIVSGITPKYREGVYKLNYSIPYYLVEGRPIVNKKKNIYFKSLDLGTYVFGTCEGDVTNLIIRNEYKNITTIQYPNFSKEIEALINDSVSGILIEEAIFKYTLFVKNKTRRINDFVILEDRIIMPLHAASYDPKILSVVNYGLKQITKEEIQEIQDLWIKKYEPSLFTLIFQEFVVWFKSHLALGTLSLFLILILMSNGIALFLYIFYPYKLILIEPYIRKVPVINIKYRSIELSFSKILFLEFFIFNERTIHSFYQRVVKTLLQKSFDFLDRRRTDKYLTLPVTIGDENVGYIPLIDNLENIKDKLKTEIGLLDTIGVTILGGGGIGKTTFALQIIEWLYNDKVFNPKPIIVIPLDFYWADIEMSQEAFNDKTQTYILKKFLMLFESKVNVSLFKYFFEKKSILLVIDSFSEYVSFKKLKIASFINEWRKSGNHFIITSRNNEYKARVGLCIEIKPQLLKTAFLMNLIEHTVISSFLTKDLSKTDSQKISEIYNLLNRITNEIGVTPLFCKMFTEVLYNSSISNISEPKTIGIYKYYETIFERYLAEIISKEESIERSKVGEVVQKSFEFASYFAWRQVTINNTFNLHNYLSRDDISDFPESDRYLNLLLSPGSIIIENSSKYKFKFDPIAEILISKFLYDRYWSLVNENNSDIIDKEFLSFENNPNKKELISTFKNLRNYINDQIRYMETDNRSEVVLNKVIRFLSIIELDEPVA